MLLGMIMAAAIATDNLPDGAPDPVFIAAESVAPAPQPGQPPAAQDPAAQAGAKSQKPAESVSCREVTPTGSHLPLKICLNHRGWREYERDSQKVMEDIQRRSIHMGQGSAVSSH